MEVQQCRLRSSWFVLMPVLPCCSGAVRPGRRSTPDAFAGVVFDAPIDLRDNRADDHAPATFQHAFMNSDRQDSVGFGLDVDHREFQRLTAAALAACLSSARNQEACVSSGLVGVP